MLTKALDVPDNTDYGLIPRQDDQTENIGLLLAEA